MSKARLTWERIEADGDNALKILDEATLASATSVESTAVDLKSGGANTCMVQLEVTFPGGDDGDPTLEILTGNTRPDKGATDKMDTESFDSITIDRTGGGTKRKSLQLVNVPRFLAKVTNNNTALALTDVIVRIAKGTWES